MMKPDESSCWPKGGFELSCFINGTFAFFSREGAVTPIA